tara:strand:- start:334 stop:561 length:228 start_codon:yes stop_codon:yes gene_type:complete
VVDVVQDTAETTVVTVDLVVDKHSVKVQVQEQQVKELTVLQAALDLVAEAVELLRLDQAVEEVPVVTVVLENHQT